MDDDKGYVILFPENMPAWALAPEERRSRLRIVEDEEQEADEEDGGS